MPQVNQHTPMQSAGGASAFDIFILYLQMYMNVYS